MEDMNKVAAARLLLDLVQRKHERNMRKQAGMRDSLIRMLGGSTKSPSVLPKILGALGLGGLGYAGYQNRDEIKDLLSTNFVERLYDTVHDQDRKESWGAQQDKERQQAMELIRSLMGSGGSSGKTPMKHKIQSGPFGG